MGTPTRPPSGAGWLTHCGVTTELPTQRGLPEVQVRGFGAARLGTSPGRH